MDNKTLSVIYNPSLILYLPLWKRDGNTFPSDDSFGHSCSVTGATWGTLGRTFDGNDYIDCGGDAQFTFAGDMSVDAWIKTSTTGAYQKLIGKMASGQFEWGFRIDDNNTARFAIYQSDSTVYSSANSSNTVTDNNWHHIAGVFDDNVSTKIYVDGIERGSSTSFAGTRGGDLGADVNIGRRAGLADLYFTGTIGEIRLYNRNLTVLEIQNLYRLTKWRYQ